MRKLPALGRLPLAVLLVAVLGLFGICDSGTTSASTQDPLRPVATRVSETPVPQYLVAGTAEVRRGSRNSVTRLVRTEQLADGQKAASGRILVQFKDGYGEEDGRSIHGEMAALGVDRAAEIGRLGPKTRVVDIGDAPVERALAAYRSDPRVASASADILFEAAETPNDPLFSQQYGMARIQAPAAWNISHGAAGVKVAVLDTGIYERGVSTYGDGHPDLNGKVVLARNFTTEDDADDWYGHGTHVAGIIAATTNNGAGVAGVGYNVSLMNGKVLGNDGTGYFSWIIEGIYWAVDNGASVINMSLGADITMPADLQAAVDYAYNHGVLVVAAAGNNGRNEQFSPAVGNHVLAVANTDSSDNKSGSSNYGTWVQVAAPGSSILSTYNEGGYASMTGTSMASPHVAGLGALLYSTMNAPAATSVFDRIVSTADAIAGTGSYWRYGRINAYRALAAGVETATPTKTPTRTPTPVPTATAVPSLTPTPAATVVLVDGREAVASRLIVGYRSGVTAAERQEVHRLAAGRGVPGAFAIAAIGENSEVVDVSGAPSLEVAIAVYGADSRVAYAQPDFMMRADANPLVTQPLTRSTSTPTPTATPSPSPAVPAARTVGVTSTSSPAAGTTSTATSIATPAMATRTPTTAPSTPTPGAPRTPTPAPTATATSNR